MSTQVALPIKLFADDIVGFSASPASTPYLIGGRCDRCDKLCFPWTQRCRHCQAPLTRVNLGSRGRVHSATLVRTKPPLGLPRPYGLAYVDLDDAPLRVLMLVDGHENQPLSIGRHVQLDIAELGVDASGERCLRPFFRAIAPVEHA
ncbi:MAG TPA: OB-fold domain-containing protein [Steroidobacter sp.]|uniref:Zn-ribbon domain-containing OB-fold protein n=1 Tax=Steroidobacter sp. TaxID=1978227 RepID=UPI002ED955CE